ACAARGRNEVAVARHAQRNDFDALIRRSGGDRSRRKNRDLMLRAQSAEDEDYALHRGRGMLPSRYFKSSSRQRMPAPTVNAVLLRTLSTPLVTNSCGVFGFSCRKMYSPYIRRWGLGS